MATKSISTWIFADAQVLSDHRKKLNQQFVRTKGKARLDIGNFLTPAEEQLILQSKEHEMMDKLSKLKKPLPPCVLCRGFQYFKRFYVTSTPMLHCVNQMFISCVHLACSACLHVMEPKEFSNIFKSPANKAYSQHLLAALNGKFNSDCVFCRAVDVMLSLKHEKYIENVACIEPHVNEFLMKQLLTDAMLLYSAKKIALAAVRYGVEQEHKRIDNFIYAKYSNEWNEDAARILADLGDISQIILTNKLPEKAKKVSALLKKVQYLEKALRKIAIEDAQSPINGLPNYETAMQTLTHNPTIDGGDGIGNGDN